MVLHDINHASRFSHEIITMKEREIVKNVTRGKSSHLAVLEEVFRIHARVMIDPGQWGTRLYLVMTIYHSKKQQRSRFIQLKG